MNRLSITKAQYQKTVYLLWKIQNAKDEFDITEIENNICLADQRKEITVNDRCKLMKYCKEFRNQRNCPIQSRKTRMDDK